MRFLFYSHDGFGLGHTCRNLAIAHVLTTSVPRAAVLLATGSDDVTRLGVSDRVGILKLPSLRKVGNERYDPRHLTLSSRDVRHLRSRLLVTTIESYRPNVLLVDKHPFGAGGELKNALAVFRRMGGRTALGLRDILDEPEAVRAEWAPHRLPQSIADHYDAVLIYGQREMFDSAQVYGFPERLAERTHYCGYVLNPTVSHAIGEVELDFTPQRRSDRPLVVATVGGGEDGLALLENFLPACRDSPWRAMAVTGPMMSDRDQSQLKLAGNVNGVVIRDFVASLHLWMQGAEAVVCMGGYNTITQALAAGSPVVCVPRVKPRREQVIRAQMLASRGLVRVIMPENLTPQSLSANISAALQTPRERLQTLIRSTMRFDGAMMAARQLQRLACTSVVRASGRARRLKVT